MLQDDSKRFPRTGQRSNIRCTLWPLVSVVTAPEYSHCWPLYHWRPDTEHSQLLNNIIFRFNSPVLLGNIFPYRSTSTGSVLENILPVELGVYFPVHPQKSWEWTRKYSLGCQNNTENKYCFPVYLHCILYPSSRHNTDKVLTAGGDTVQIC